MMLLPLPERGYHTAAWTTGLVLFNVLVFALTWPMELRRASAVSRDVWRESAAQLQTLAQAEASGFSAEIQQALLESPSADTYPSGALLQSFRQIQDNPRSLTSARRYQWEAQYPHFSMMTASIASSREGSSPFRILGFRPTLSWFPGVLTHQFLHAGWWHLIGNMIFLWVVGFVLEFGVGGYLLALYLVGGIGAAWAQVHFGNLGNEIMVGASGAIAALMGFALVAIPSARVKLFYLTWGRAGTFHAPLWFFLPFWILEQYFQAGMAVGEEAVKVGYAAHFGGFFFGAILALISRFVLPTPIRTPENPNTSW